MKIRIFTEISQELKSRGSDIAFVEPNKRWESDYDRGVYRTVFYPNGVGTSDCEGPRDRVWIVTPIATLTVGSETRFASYNSAARTYHVL